MKPPLLNVKAKMKIEKVAAAASDTLPDTTDVANRSFIIGDRTGDHDGNIGPR